MYAYNPNLPAYNPNLPYVYDNEAFYVPTQPHYSAPQTPNLYPDLGYVARPCVITKDVHHYTTHLLKQAKAVAQAVQFPVANSPRSSSSSHSSSPWFVYAPRTYSLFSPTTTNNYSSSNSSGNNDTTLRIGAAILGVVALVVGAILMGKAQARNDNLDEKMKEFADSVRTWNYHRPAYTASPIYQHRLDNVIDLTKGIMDRNKSNIFSSIYKVALPIIVGGGLLVGGAVVGASVGAGLMGLGVLTLAGAGTYGIYKAVRNANTDLDKNAATKIFEQIFKLEKTIEHQTFEAVWAEPTEYFPPRGQ